MFYRNLIFVLFFSIFLSCSDDLYVEPALKIPIINIEINNFEEINSKDDYVKGTFEFNSGDYDFEDFVQPIKIRGRGNSTWDMPKKSYQFKLDEKHNLFNFPEDKKWLMLANYSDKTMLRNALAFELGYLSKLDWTPNYHFAEVVINGKAKGLYQFTEKVETGNDNYIRHGDAGSIRTFLNVANGANAYSFPYGITSANTGNTVVLRNASGNFNAGTITATLSGNATTASSSLKFMSTSHNGTYWLTNNWDGSYWKIDSNHSSGTRVDYANNAGVATSANSVAYGNVTGTPFIPTHTSQLTNNSGFVTSSGFVNGNALSATTGTFSSTLTSAGDIIAYYSSDERLKDNVQVIDGALEKVSKLRGVEFDWNDKQDTYEGHDIGVIAQDVEAVAPELVQTREDGFKAVKYEKLTALLIEAVKELKEENKQIRDELEKLRSINS